MLALFPLQMQFELCNTLYAANEMDGSNAGNCSILIEIQAIRCVIARAVQVLVEDIE